MLINKLKISFLGIGVVAAGVFPIAAQYDQDITVEGKYVPEYIAHDRIGLFPKPLKLETQKSELSYYMKGVNANFEPSLVPLQATGWNTNRTYSRSRGYLDLGLASWLTSTLSAGYRIIDTDQTVFGIRLQHNSTSLWKPEISEAMRDVKRSRYDEMIGLYASHDFNGAGRLDAALDYHLGYFNYYGADMPRLSSGAQGGASFDLKAPTQTLNDIAARVQWNSRAGRDVFSWFAGAAVRYFGYRSVYGLDGFNLNSGYPSAQGSRETNTALQAGFVFPTSEKSAVGLDFEGDLVTYAKRNDSAGSLYDVENPDNYGILYFTPYYRFNRSGIDIKLGARVDLSFNAGPKNDRYSTFHIAPDVKLDYNAGPVALYLYAQGGSKLNTLASRYENDYYQDPLLLSTIPVYSPVDATFGVTFGPFSGFHAGLSVAYRISRGQYSGGWYMATLSGNNIFDSGLPERLDGRLLNYDLSPEVRYDLSGFSFGASLGYDAGRYFKIDASGHYQRQHGETGYFNGYDRPEWTADVVAESNPWNTLKLKLGYSLRAMRMMAAPASWADSTPLNGLFYVDYRLPNQSMLNFGASYGITQNFDVWIQADNLLNRKSFYLPMAPEPGITLTAGIGLRF